MRHGDIFMGAFNADQVMYNHFGYRTPVPNLYVAGSPCHPGGAISGGAGYIAAGIIARDLGLKTWWQPWDARAALQGLAQAQAHEVEHVHRTEPMATPHPIDSNSCRPRSPAAWR